MHILVSCTERKRLPVPKELRLRTVRVSDVKERAKLWCKRLERARGPRLGAAELYAGDHWTVARRLPGVAKAQGMSATLWVISAGYGLVPATAPLHPYSATFSPGHPDSVSRGNAPEGVKQAWWAMLAQRKGPDRSAPRSVSELAREEPRARLLVVASEHYVQALEADLCGAADLINEAEQLLLVSTGGKMMRRSLAIHLVPTKACWQAKLGGARTSLHARVAEWILKAGKVGVAAELVRSELERALEGGVAVPEAERRRMGDDEVRQFIRQALLGDPKAGHTRLLRALRESGRACEQARFRKLFAEVTGRRYEKE